MNNALSVSKVVDGINYIYEKFEKIINGYKSINSDKIFGSKQVKGFIPKNYNDSKNTSTQKLFCELKKAVDDVVKVRDSLKVDDKEKLKMTWKNAWKRCDYIVKKASDKSRIKNKRVEKALEKLEKIFENNKSESDNKPNDKSNSKYNLKESLKKRNEKIREIVDDFEEFAEYIEKDYNLKDYNSTHIYVLKKMYKNYFSKYIRKKETSKNKETAIVKYFSTCQDSIDKLDFDIYKKIMGIDEMVSYLRGTGVGYNSNAYTEASRVFKEKFPDCFPIPKMGLGILNDKKVVRAIKRLREKSAKCKLVSDS